MKAFLLTVTRESGVPMATSYTPGRATSLSEWLMTQVRTEVATRLAPPELRAEIDKAFVAQSMT